MQEFYRFEINEYHALVMLRMPRSPDRIMKKGFVPTERNIISAAFRIRRSHVSVTCTWIYFVPTGRLRVLRARLGLDPRERGVRLDSFPGFNLNPFPPTYSRKFSFVCTARGRLEFGHEFTALYLLFNFAK